MGQKESIKAIGASLRIIKIRNSFKAKELYKKFNKRLKLFGDKYVEM